MGPKESDEMEVEIPSGPTTRYWKPTLSEGERLVFASVFAGGYNAYMIHAAELDEDTIIEESKKAARGAVGSAAVAVHSLRALRSDGGLTKGVREMIREMCGGPCPGVNEE